MKKGREEESKGEENMCLKRRKSFSFSSSFLNVITFVLLLAVLVT
jgi:hypothetical protein